MVAVLAAAFPVVSNAWEITGATLLPAADLAVAAGDQGAAEAGAAVVAAYRKAGFLTVGVSVSEERQTITVIERVARSAGSYGSYFPSGSVLTSDDVNLASARLSAAARMNGERVAVSVSQSGQESEVTASGVAVEDAKMKGASLIYSSLGQRYSGSDVLTAYGWANLGNGQQIDGSVAHAFSDWREDSEDGAFNNVTAGYRKASEYGLTSVQLMAAKYKTGGVSAPLDINGSIIRLNVEHDYLLTPALTGLARLSFVKNDQEIGVMGWEDSEKYASLLVGGKYTGAKNGFNYNLDIGAEVGLGGKRDYNFAPLMGLFDPNFTVLTANGLASYSFGESGWSVLGKAGGQHGYDEAGGDTTHGVSPLLTGLRTRRRAGRRLR